ncbi:heterokaryon incompatibility protein-domain-containing protein [Bisporella sp. PMI_857]|nr:heterokaryon incompatibility protein-domain-containing protein [Bisporella sp. PMI_857]
MAGLSPESTVSFCPKCQPFKLDSEAFSLSLLQNRRMHQLGQYKEVSSRPSCPLCRFITATFRDGPVPPIVLQDSHFQGCWSRISNNSQETSLTIWLVLPSEVDKVELNIRQIAGNQSVAQGLGRVIENASIDVELVKKWINLCRTKHNCSTMTIKGSSSRSLPPGFMVIDVLRNCLSSLPVSSTYLALSYVWGESVKFKTTSKNVGSLHQENSLQKIWDQLSPTIRDAIELTRMIHQRYLWIDSLCIMQDNATNSQSNIEAMDSIYQQALLVITAADDKAMQNGLLGITTPRKSMQHRTVLLPGLPVMATFNYSAYMTSGLYGSRGWTFQEEHLSTRALIFINNQVYFSCRSHVFAEDVHEGEDADPDQTLKVVHIAKRFIRDGVASSILYFQAVQEYTLRNLTFTSDKLNAFRGVENVLNQVLKTGSIAGLPGCIFDITLLWQPNGRSSRNVEFPSWSWAGWTSSVHWAGDTLDLASYGYFATPEQERLHLTNWLRERTWIEWYRYTPEGGIVPVWVVPSGLHNDDSHIGYDPAAVTKADLYGRKDKTDPIISRYRTMSDAKAPLLTKLAKVAPEILALGFHTLLAQFQIRASDAYLRYGSIDKPWDSNGRVVFLLQNKKSQPCGYVLLDDIWTTKYSMDKPYDFLMLSEANYSCQWRRPHEDHPYKKYYGFGPDWEEFYVMMVEWKTLIGIDGDEMKAAERVGLGRVLKESIWDSCGNVPIWTEIVLV